MNLDLNEIGVRFKRVREELLKVSQKDLAVTVGTNQVSISNLEKGKGVVPGLLIVLMNFLYSEGFNAALIFRDIEFEPHDLNKKPTKEAIIKTLEESRNAICRTILGTIEKLKAQ